MSTFDPAVSAACRQRVQNHLSNITPVLTKTSVYAFRQAHALADALPFRATPQEAEATINAINTMLVEEQRALAR